MFKWTMVLPAIGCLALCSCQTVSADFRSIREPIMLNQYQSEWKKAELPYRASATSETSSVASPQLGGAPGTTETLAESSSTGTNNLQTVAFYLIVCYPDRALTGMEFDLRAWGMNALFGLWSKLEMQAEATLIEQEVKHES